MNIYCECEHFEILIKSEINMLYKMDSNSWKICLFYLIFLT